MKKNICLVFVLLLLSQIVISNNKSYLKDKVYQSVEVRAKSKWTSSEFNEYVDNFVHYPDSEYVNNVQGVVYVKFIVRKDATIDSLTIYKGLTKNLENEAIRLIRNVNGWIPALINNNPVSSYLVYPVKFIKKDSVIAKILLNDVLVEIDGKKMPYGLSVNLINSDLIESGVYIKPYPKLVKDSLMAVYGPDVKNGILKISTSKTNYFSPSFENNKFCIVEGDTVFKSDNLKFLSSNSTETLKDFIINYKNYPLIAKKLNLEGNVFLNVVVDNTGKVDNVYFQKNSNLYFSKILRACLAKMPLLQPLVVDGKFVKSIVSFTVSFYIDNDGAYVVSNEQIYREIKCVKTKVLQVCSATIPLDLDLALINENELDFVNINPPVNNDSLLNQEVLVGICPKVSLVSVTTTKVFERFFDTVDSTFDSSNCFQIVEQMPRFVGGDAALFQFLKNNIRYPVVCQENRISGRVITSFVVRADGSVGNINIIRSPDPLLSQEAVRLVGSMPNWIPGEQFGKKVNVILSVPINFVVN